MSKYDSPYFNSERYYDPTAGAALAMLARKEREEKRREYDRMIHMRLLRFTVNDPVTMFAIRYAKRYEAIHGTKKSGKPKALANPTKNRNYIRAYIYCMDRAYDDPDLEANVKKLFGIEGRRIRQCFTRTGDIGKLVNAWLDYVDGGEQNETN